MSVSINTCTSKPLLFSTSKFWIIVFSFLPNFRVWTAASNWTRVQFLQTFHKYHTDSIEDEMDVKVCSELPCSLVVVVTDINAGLVAKSLLALTTQWTVSHQAALSMGILQERILVWVAMPSSRGSSRPRDQSCISCIAGGFFTDCASRETPQILVENSNWLTLFIIRLHIQ